MILKPQRVDCGVREIKKKQEERLGDQLVQTSFDLQKRMIQSVGKRDLMDGVCLCLCARVCVSVCG